MLIFWNKKLAYLAVPKTGTTSIEASLSLKADIVLRNPPRLKHMTARMFEKKFAPATSDKDAFKFETVAMMREPVDWLGSWYRYRKRPQLSGKPASTEGISFDTFIESYLSDERPIYADIGSQFKFMTDKDGNILVDHIFDYAYFSQLIEFLENKLELSMELGHTNKSPKEELSLSPSLLFELKRLYNKDFELYAKVRVQALKSTQP